MAAWEKKWENRSYRFHLSIFWQQAADYKIMCLYDDFWKCRFLFLCVLAFRPHKHGILGRTKKKVFLKNDLRTVYKLFSQVSCRWKWFLKCRCHSVNLCMPVVVFMNVLVLCCFYYSLFFIKLLQFNFRFYFTVTLFHFRTAFRLFSSRYAWS